jgi:ribosome-associated protein YbcJ (S4-like RNA binding protein)
MSVEAAISGEGFRLVLRVHGYERPTLDSGSDANWLMAEAELTASGSYQARDAVSLRTEELLAFRDQLAQLVENLNGEAELSHLEGQVGCTVRLQAGRGEATAFLRQHVGAELRISGMKTDQSYLQHALHDFDALARDFPVRGDPVA